MDGNWAEDQRQREELEKLQQELMNTLEQI